MITPITQQHKSMSLREIVSRFQQGLPVNVIEHRTFDLDSEPDFDSVVFDDFSDKLEASEFVISQSEEINEKISKHQQTKETKTSAPSSSSTSAAADKPQGAQDNSNNSNPSNNETQKNETPQN